jgi:mRNA-degrading endonuclease toxin of MazEF toxin-antitoxin module
MRRQVWGFKLEGVDDPHPFLILSNNHRNQHYGEVTTLRITTKPKNPQNPTVVALQQADHPLKGFVICDDLAPLPKAWIVGQQPWGYLCQDSMTKVETGVMVALGIVEP